MKSEVNKTQARAPQMSKPFVLFPGKKRNCMAIKEEKASSVEAPVKICVDERGPERTLKVGSVLNPKIKDELAKLLKEFEDIFAYALGTNEKSGRRSRSTEAVGI